MPWAQVSASTSYTSHTGNSGCQQEVLLPEHWAHGRSSCPKSSVPKHTLAWRLSHLPSPTTTGNCRARAPPRRVTQERKQVAESPWNQPWPKPMCGPSPAVHGAQESLLPLPELASWPTCRDPSAEDRQCQARPLPQAPAMCPHRGRAHTLTRVAGPAT